MNFARGLFERWEPDQVALVEIDRSGARRDWTMSEVAHASGSLAAEFVERGLKPGDVVLTVVGNRPDWVFTMMACFWTGTVALACTEQLRLGDLQHRIEMTSPRLVVADRRNAPVVEKAAADCPVLWSPTSGAPRSGRPPFADLNDDDPCLLTFTSGTAGAAKPVLHSQRYLHGQELQARHWLSCREGDLLWCTAASGWSKSARNVFVSPWLTRATAMIHDGRFDPDERMSMIEDHKVTVLCMAPTEYRVMCKRTALRPMLSLRTCVAAGEALEGSTVEAWRDAVGISIRDGYGQTETGQITCQPAGTEPRPGSMGRPLPGVKVWIEDGELIVDPSSLPTFFSGYLGEAPSTLEQPWRTGDRARMDADGYLWFEGRGDDVIISSGYRIGPFEVESALMLHPDVAEAAVIGVPDDERGSIVQALVIACDGVEAGPELETALKDHVKQVTAPYKYPRRIVFVEELPKTTSGKIRRAALRKEFGADR
jgi:acyl-coenzyme A synthetase/AMP-(fatty) acid ligase